MPPRTRSRRRVIKGAPQETKPVKTGAIRKSVSKPTPKAPLEKKVRKYYILPEEEAENQPVLHLAKLPLELFLEIATHLYPLDLIHLSRTAKIFRGIFMRRQVADVWRTTLANVGLPLCPDGSVSEPRYAALIHLKQCSECYKPTTHFMDPILLVRLCHACRKHMVLDTKAVGVLANVLTHSQYLLPLRGKSRQVSYLLREYEDIKEIAHELEGGDRDVWHDWKEGRKGFVQTRHERAKPLIRWLTIREEEQRQANNELKNARAAQVQARLLELGWNITDIRDAGNHSAKWTSLVYRAEPLNDEGWNDILPSLLSELNKAWKERLRMELRQSGQIRKRMIEDWLLLLFDELRPTNLTLRWREPGNRDTVKTSCAPLYPRGVGKQDITIRISSIPPSYDLMEHCPHLRILVRCNKSMEEFRAQFQKTQSDLKEQYSGWRASLEAALVKTLPNDLKPVETQNTHFDLQPMDQPNSTGAMNSGDRLSPDLRVLLRADVRFKCYNGTYYYPTGFDSLKTTSGDSTYDVASSSAAKAILRTLQRPDASYLEMRALGQSFLCVRCLDEPKYYTWDDIVTHYVGEDETWSKVQSLNQLHARKGKGITLLPTHNLDEADEKPLVRLVATEDQVFRSNSPQSECKLCLHIGHCYQKGAAYLVRHVREVHSIEKPVLGEHYAEVLPS